MQSDARDVTAAGDLRDVSWWSAGTMHFSIWTASIVRTGQSKSGGACPATGGKGLQLNADKTLAQKNCLE